MDQSPILLTKQTSWYGAFSGYYEQLPKFITELEPGTKSIRPEPGLYNRIRGKAYAVSRGWSPRNQSESAAALDFRRMIRQRPLAPAHILSIEEHLDFFDEWEHAPENLIATVHFPRSLWKPAMISKLRRVSSVIALYRSEIPFFESIVGKGRVFFLYHGVHTDFFAPAPERPTGNPRIIFCGQFIRNSRMFVRVAKRLIERHPELRFDLVMPEHGRELPGFSEILDAPWVTWKHGASDVELRDLLRNAALMLLPLNDSGANNAIVESLSCGTPIATTDVGGIADYGGGSIYPVVKNDDDDAMVALVEKYLGDEAWRSDIARKSREFAVDYLAWPKVAREHQRLYHKLARQSEATLVSVNGRRDQPPAPRPRGKLRVAIVNSYLDGREALCGENLYPRNHLWGADAMIDAGWDVKFLRPPSRPTVRRLNDAMGRRLGDPDFDLKLMKRADDFDVIYIAQGRLPLTQWARRRGSIKAKLVQWEYVPPHTGKWWRFRDIWHRRFLARGIDAFACLTEGAASAFRELNPDALVRAIQWAPDTTMFPGCEKDGEYFLACGRTNRDYATLIEAAGKVSFPIVMLVPTSLMQGMAIPPNVRFVEGPKDGGTDRGIPYSELIHDWYANARAVLIPRIDLAWDASGFTNLLEAMAMHRPVLMTRTGKLDLDVEKTGIGMFVAPKDATEWAAKMTLIWNDAELRAKMRAAAREQVKAFYNLRRFGHDAVEFVREVAARK